MIQDRQQLYYFAEQLQQITPITIPTSFGDIYAQTVGQKGQPLILFVHGSGPKNSSNQFQLLLHQYLVRISYIQKFYIVAIDCPGYGKSKGSMLTIKTFPLQFFKQILVQLGYKTYFAMLGSSQGGAAIFNSVYEDPSIAQFLLMVKPVCGNIKRFNRFNTPTLLVYDIQDDGHPIWQGKQLYKQLTKTQLHTYRGSQQPYWIPDNIWNTILRFIRKYSINRKNQKNEFIHKSLQKQKERKRSLSSASKKNRKKAVSMDKWWQKKQEQKEEKDINERLLQIKQIDKSQLYSKISDFEEFEELPLSFNQPKIQQTQQEARLEEKKILQQKNLFNQINMKKSIQKKQQQKKQQQQKQEKKKQQQQKEEKEEIKKQQQIQKINIKIQKHTTQKKQKIQKTQKSEDEKKQYRCPICYEIPYYPLQTNCKHLFCSKCIRESLLVDQRCPMCRSKVNRKQARSDLNEVYLKQLSNQQKQKRKIQLYKFQQLLKSIVYVQIGNHSRQLPTKKSAFTSTKKKYKWQIYAKQPKNFKFEEVGFNINMGNRDAVPVKVTTNPFCFQSRGTFSFSCQIIIKPRNRQYQPITTVYRIDVTPGTHSKTIALRKKK